MKNRRPVAMLFSGLFVGSMSLIAIADTTPTQTELVPPGSPGGAAAAAAGAGKEQEFSPFDSVTKDTEKVISTADGATSFYTLYANKKDGSLFAELPKDYENKLVMIAPTIAGGDQESGVMAAPYTATGSASINRLC